MRTQYIGLDLGQVNDPSALVIVRIGGPGATVPLPREILWQDRRPVLTVRTLHRWPLRTSYLTIASDLAQLVARCYRAGIRSHIVPDSTGIGRGICEVVLRALRAGDCGPWLLAPVTITAGQAITYPAGDFAHVAKIQLVSVVQSVLQARRLKIAAKHPLAEALRRELATFKMKVTAAGTETFGARGRDHDDLVIALALGVFRAEQQLSRVA